MKLLFWRQARWWTSATLSMKEKQKSFAYLCRSNCFLNYGKGGFFRNLIRYVYQAIIIVLLFWSHSFNKQRDSKQVFSICALINLRAVKKNNNSKILSPILSNMCTLRVKFVHFRSTQSFDALMYMTFFFLSHFWLFHF